jgi:hypothetical protein
VKKKRRFEWPERVLPLPVENAAVNAGTKRIKMLRPRKLTMTLKLMPTSTIVVISGVALSAWSSADTLTSKSQGKHFGTEGEGDWSGTNTIKESENDNRESRY